MPAAHLPFAGACFDAVVSNDAMCRLPDRSAVLRDWHRVLRPGGRALFTDAMVLTGIVSDEELATRSSIGFYRFVPPGANEKMLREAGFVVLSVHDVTANAAEVASRWYEARGRHREALVAREGEVNFDGLQRFLRCVHTLSVEGRLSWYAYLGGEAGAGILAGANRTPRHGRSILGRPHRCSYIRRRVTWTPVP
jgi:SAM-dependent methyltransferase